MRVLVTFWMAGRTHVEKIIGNLRRRQPVEMLSQTPERTARPLAVRQLVRQSGVEGKVVVRRTRHERFQPNHEAGDNFNDSCVSAGWWLSNLGKPFLVRSRLGTGEDRISRCRC